MLQYKYNDKGASDMDYREEISKTKRFKQEYLDGLDRLILDRQLEMAEKRKEYGKNIFEDQEAYREDFKKMLGWPLVDHESKGLPSVKCEKLSDGSGYSVYRMRFEILDGVTVTGLYFQVDGDGKKPLVLVQHGGNGTPELISGFYGDTCNYNLMLERVIAQGVNAFAPQLLLWDESYGIPFDRVNIDARLKRVGSSITAVELYGLTRILDYFEAHDNVSSFGMVGLSYGGFYTLFLSALDKRIRSAVSCSFFSTRDAYPWSDWTWFRSAEKLDDAEIACLVYPRKLCIEIGTKDALFDVKHGMDAFETLTELCKDVGTEWLTFIPFDGTHEFCHNDEPITEMVKDLLADAN